MSTATILGKDSSKLERPFIVSGRDADFLAQHFAGAGLRRSSVKPCVCKEKAIITRHVHQALLEPRVAGPHCGWLFEAGGGTMCQSLGGSSRVKGKRLKWRKRPGFARYLWRSPCVSCLCVRPGIRSEWLYPHCGAWLPHLSAHRRGVRHRLLHSLCILQAREAGFTVTCMRRTKVIAMSCPTRGWDLQSDPKHWSK